MAQAHCTLTVCTACALRALRVHLLCIYCADARAGCGRAAARARARAARRASLARGAESVDLWSRRGGHGGWGGRSWRGGRGGHGWRG
eukprot:scaffold33685_cov63-Phaeocystis_antarctica.AAC.1